MKKLVLTILLLIVAVPAFAATIGNDLTVAVAGQIVLPDRDLAYVSEFAISNHRRGVTQLVDVYWIDGATPNVPVQRLALRELSTMYRRASTAGQFLGIPGRLGALRFVAVDESGKPDPAARIEVRSFVVGLRGRFGTLGETRQEIETFPASAYLNTEANFLGLRNDDATHTNVGIVNLHSAQQTFSVNHGSVTLDVDVPAHSLVQFRMPRSANENDTNIQITPAWAQWVREYPEVAAPWVAYTSSVDSRTGDAHSGIRVYHNHFAPQP